ncbi:hypothetical protein BKA59DRAFT_19868 [Fusarium tricinctum]|uniref:Uncharacterized protein n=1 Tax=Fusarium tricinctum TaxID=61284 RepID=A0A8K0WGN8_9HYPO|nr:hypothetical protein BKA59DRAFT_19868 [Fusarium tricinctum]
MAWGMLSRLGTSLLPPVFLTLVTAASVMQIEAKASGFYSIQVIRTTDSLGPSRGVLPWKCTPISTTTLLSTNARLVLAQLLNSRLMRSSSRGELMMGLLQRFSVTEKQSCCLFYLSINITLGYCPDEPHPGLKYCCHARLARQPAGQPQHHGEMASS